MKITGIEYSKLITGGNYNNTRHAAMAEVDDGESPDEVHAKLVEWVESKFSEDPATRDLVVSKENLEDNIDGLQHELDNLRVKLDDARFRWDAALAFLTLHGLDTSTIGEVPF